LFIVAKGVKSTPKLKLWANQSKISMAITAGACAANF
jgi:hypothetical protein